MMIDIQTPTMLVYGIELATAECAHCLQWGYQQVDLPEVRNPIEFIQLLLGLVENQTGQRLRFIFSSRASFGDTTLIYGVPLLTLGGPVVPKALSVALQMVIQLLGVKKIRRILYKELEHHPAPHKELMNGNGMKHEAMEMEGEVQTEGEDHHCAVCPHNHSSNKLQFKKIEQQQPQPMDAVNMRDAVMDTDWLSAKPIWRYVEVDFHRRRLLSAVLGELKSLDPPWHLRAFPSMMKLGHQVNTFIQQPTIAMQAPVLSESEINLAAPSPLASPGQSPHEQGISPMPSPVSPDCRVD